MHAMRAPKSPRSNTPQTAHPRKKVYEHRPPLIISSVDTSPSNRANPGSRNPHAPTLHPERAPVGEPCAGAPTGPKRRGLLTVLFALAFSIPALAQAEDPQETVHAARQAAAKKTFDQKIAPFLTTYCTDCHGDKVRKAGLTFRTALKNPAAPDFRKHWKRSLASLNAHDMPPEDAKKQPSPEEVQVFSDWVAEMKFLSPKDPGQFVLRRLNKVEYGNTLHELLGSDPALAKELPDEVFGAGYLNSLSPLLMEQYLSIAGDVLNSIWPPETPLPASLQKRLFGPTPLHPDPNPEALRTALRGLARKAYRRPPTESELDVLSSVFTLAQKAGRTHDERIRLVLKALLVSPQFLFITPENHPDTDAAIVPLDDFQLAARLSYLLWSAPPDAELSALADKSSLHEPGVLAQQVRRMLADPRARALFDGFGAQWLGIGKLATKTFDSRKFPQMDGTLRNAMYDEARLLFEAVVRENRSVMGFIDCDHTFLNESLAAVYGLEAEVSGPHMRRVQLRNPDRGGVLGMPGILATTSFPDRTSPVNRGVWVLEQLLGEHVPPPPPNVPTLEKQDKTKIAGLTLRQRTELHRTNAVCMSCHKVLDPIGFGLENWFFAVFGGWRR
jgi:hypothetical protein